MKIVTFVPGPLEVIYILGAMFTWFACLHELWKIRSKFTSTKSLALALFGAAIAGYIWPIIWIIAIVFAVKYKNFTK